MQFFFCPTQDHSVLVLYMSVITSYNKKQTAFMKWAKFISLNSMLLTLQSTAFIQMSIDEYFITSEQAS